MLGVEKVHLRSRHKHVGIFVQKLVEPIALRNIRDHRRVEQRRPREAVALFVGHQMQQHLSALAVAAELAVIPVPVLVEKPVYISPHCLVLGRARYSVPGEHAEVERVHEILNPACG